MKIPVIAAFLLLFSLPLFSQTSLGGVVNDYQKVVGIVSCEAKLTCAAAPPFSVGDPVILVQMQGATIDEADADSFGDVTEFGGAGLFEQNEVAAISGNDVFLKYTLYSGYDVAGNVQLVSFPSYPSAIVTETLTAQPWDGSTGGVLAFQVTGQLILDADLDVSSQGFRGGALNVLTSDCSFLTFANDYFYDLGNWRGSPKGEGIAEIIVGKEQGRGAQANGGGGGNDHNAGGGGGANVTPAGLGGQQSVGSFGCQGNFPGEPGKMLDPAPDRIFLGGGGGAGHADNVGAGSPGGNGGGIVLLRAGELIGNGFRILANGQTPNNGAFIGDGQGGGGAGGTVLLDVTTFTGGLSVEAKGGNGGNADNPPTRCFGVGGGGGGGRVISTQTIAVTALGGGEPGVNSIASSQCDGDPSNGATAGAAGVEEVFSGIPFSTEEPAMVSILAQPEPASTCEGEEADFEFLLAGDGLTYTWQSDDGSGWQDLMNGAVFTGVFSENLTVLAPDPSMDGHQFRCLVVSACGDEIISQPAILTVLPAPVADFSSANLGGTTVQFTSNSVNADSYFWDFGDTNNSLDENPLHTYADFGEYTVTLTVTNDCGEASFSLMVTTGELPLAMFAAQNTGGCAPLTIEFEDLSAGSNLTSWQWAFEGGTPATSAEQNPEVTYFAAGDFDVELTVANDLGTNTLLLEDYILVAELPFSDFDFLVNELTVTFTNNSTGGNTALWDFGDSQTSSEWSPVHEYVAPGPYSVSLNVSNLNCGSSVTKELLIEPPNAVGEIGFDGKILVRPNPAHDFLEVQLEGFPSEKMQLSLTDITGRVWRQAKVSGTSTRLDLEGVPAGIYVLSFFGEKTLGQVRVVVE